MKLTSLSGIYFYKKQNIMFRHSYQKGFLSIFYSLGGKPLSIWKTNVQNGHIKRLVDDDVHSVALEIMGSNVATTYITTPSDPKQSLGIKLPFFVLLILDDKNMHRRFRFSNYQSTSRVKPFSTSMPLGLSPGWNQIQFNLADFTRRAYGTNYVETIRVQVHANVRIRRIYFTDRLYTEEELPSEFRIMTSQADVRRSSTKKGNRSDGCPSSPVKNKMDAGDGTVKRTQQICTAPCATRTN